ncbi:hypothetical protein L916_01555 [Phytophthora nicotianae]|uniref:Uncharacterized protein n=1 Tax=Phytophthora nicotianae TaxID=4792 RepID=W2JR36_PHYNI|nr:hypothetical protein L916_01555 [Phytophthora nicotianae]
MLTNGIDFCMQLLELSSKKVTTAYYYVGLTCCKVDELGPVKALPP